MTFADALEHHCRCEAAGQSSHKVPLLVKRVERMTLGLVVALLFLGCYFLLRFVDWKNNIKGRMRDEEL